MLLAFVLAGSGYIVQPTTGAGGVSQLAARRGCALLPRAAPTAVLNDATALAVVHLVRAARTPVLDDAAALAAATNIIIVGYVAANFAVGVVIGVVVREGQYVLPWGGAGKGTPWKARRADVRTPG